ncbi:MAG: WD40 repeat domain-containing protein [Acidobacteriota bacterium]
MANDDSVTSELAVPARELIRQYDLTWIDETSEALAQGTPTLNVADSIDKLFNTRAAIRVCDCNGWRRASLFCLVQRFLSCFDPTKSQCGECGNLTGRGIAKRATNAQALAEQKTKRLKWQPKKRIAKKTLHLSGAKEAKRQEGIALSNAERPNSSKVLAENNARTAKSQALASYSVAQQTIDPDLSLALNEQALELAQGEQSKDSVRNFLVVSPMRMVIRNHAKATVRNVDNPLGQDIFSSAEVTSAAYSPDGRFIVTASFDKTARVWNAASGQVVVELKGHAAYVTNAVYSPDGRFIVTTSDDQTARVWNAASGQVVVELKGHADEVNCTAYSPDGRFIVTASSDKTARVWNAASGQVVAELKGHADGVMSTACVRTGASL